MHMHACIWALTLHPIVRVPWIAPLHGHKCLRLGVGNERLGPHVHAGKLVVEAWAHRGPVGVGSHHLKVWQGIYASTRLRGVSRSVSGRLPLHKPSDCLDRVVSLVALQPLGVFT